MIKPQVKVKYFKIDGYKEPLDMTSYGVDRFVFGYCTEGEVLAEIDGTSYLLKAGQFMFVPENKRIVIKYFNNCKCFYGLFSISFLKDASYPVLRSTGPVFQSFWFDDAVFMANLINRMVSANDDKDYVFLKSALDMILCQLRQNSKVALIPDKFLKLVFDGDKAPLTVSEYASILCVTPNYLNKAVKQHTHRTAIDWIEIARINLAKQFLKDHTVPIGDVAGRVGIQDQSYFARFFKKKTGYTPSEYRNS